MARHCGITGCQNVEQQAKKYFRYFQTMAAPRIVLISGCSTGIGFYTALLLAKDARKSYRVYATMRNLDKRTALEEQGKDQLGNTLIIKRMDVSSDESVDSLVQEIFTKEGKIDVLSK